MECAEIKKHLSEYIDGQLDAETEASVKRHLASCKVCTADLASMRVLVDELGDLDPVVAPANFMDQLHRRIEAPSGFSKFARALFIPFKIKIPMEFAGAVAAAVLVFIVLNVQEPKDAVRHRPMALKQEEPTREIAPTSPAPHRSATPKHAKLARKSAPAAPKPPAMLKASKTLPAVEDHKEDKAVPPPIALALVIRTDRPRLRASAPSASSEPIESLPAETKREKGVTVAGQAHPKVSAEVPNAVDEEKEDPVPFGVSDRSYKDRPLPSSAYPTTLFPRVRDLVTLNHGRVLWVEYEKNTRTPRSILVDIPADRIGIFSNSLKAWGDLKTPLPTPSEDTGEMVQVLIRFLYPG